MSHLSYKHGSSPKNELKSKECIDLVLQPLKYHVTIKVNGSLTSEDIFRTVVSLTMSHYQMKTSSLDHIKPNTLFAAKSMTANGVTV